MMRRSKSSSAVQEKSFLHETYPNINKRQKSVLKRLKTYPKINKRQKTVLRRQKTVVGAESWIKRLTTWS